MTIALPRLRETRARLKQDKRGSTDNIDTLQSYQDEAEKIISEMNAAKIAAMREVEAPYLARLAEIDAEMAALLELIA